MRPAWWLLALSCTAAGPTQPLESDTDADTDADADADADTDTDTAPPSPRFPPFDTGPFGAAHGTGHVMVRHLASTGDVIVSGVFVDDDGGHIDLAGCWPEPDTLCPTAVAGTDWIPSPAFDPNQRTFLGVGPSLLVGPWSAPRRSDPVAGVHYRGESAGPWSPSTPVGLTFAGGQWSPFVGPATTLVPPSIRLNRPFPGEPVRLVDGSTFAVQWVPQPGEHELVLEVRGANEPASTPLFLRRVLPDTGTAILDVDALGLSEQNQDLHFVLARTRRSTFDASGNPVTLVLRTEVAFDAKHPDLRRRQSLDAVDACDLAPSLAGEGRWYTTLDFSANTFSGTVCTPAISRGRDAVFSVPVAAGERVRIDAERLGGDTNLSLVADCNDLSTCLAVADVAPAGTPETLVYTNQSAVSQILTLIADAPTVSAAWVQTLDVTRDRPTLDPFADSCAEATLLPPVQPGTFTVSLTGAVDHLNPTSGACSLEPTGGPDVLIPLDVPADTTVDVRAAGPVSLYLLANCVDEGTCDAAAARFAPLRWHNATGAVARRTLVVDQPAGFPTVGPVDLTLTYVQPVTALADRCADVGAPFTTGLHLIDATLSSADHDLPTPSCTFDDATGPDGVLPVRLQPGETLTATLRHASEGVLYLLDDCGGSTLTCDDQPGRDERLAFTNDETTPRDVVVVVDTWRAPGSLPVSAAVSVELQIQ